MELVNRNIRIKCNITASQANQINKLFYLKIRLHKTIANIRFNKRCIENNITPKYAQIPIKGNSIAARKTKTYAEIQRVRNEIKQLYIKKDQITHAIYKQHLMISNKITPHEFNEFNTKIHWHIKNLMINIKNTHDKKILELTIKQNPNSNNKVFAERVVNLTNVNFNEKQLNLLQKGPKYNIKTSNKDKIESLIHDSENAIRKLPAQDQEHVRNLVANKIDKIIHSNKTENIPELKTIKSINKIITDNKLTITKADKSQTLIIIEREKYIEKTEQFIQENNGKEMKNDPTEKYNREINNIIKNTATIHKKDRNKLTQSNPSAPKLKALIKLHKPNHPIRPLINFVTAPSYKISKHLANTLTTKLNLPNIYNIRNNMELLDKLHKINISHNTKIMSFDIKNLYTNIPVTETIDIIKNKLENNTENTNICNNLKTILNQNYFRFNNKYYKMDNGLAMGSPLSNIMSETFLQHYEHSIIKEIKKKYNITIWIRYVDDILCIVESNENISTQILNILNNQHKKLQYTYEDEHNNSICFLDIRITKDMNNLKLTFDIHRKETSTDTLIHKESQHPTQHKIAAISALIQRMKTLSKYSNIDKEKEIIETMVQNNGYNKNIVNRIINKSTKNKIQSEDNKYWSTFTYTDPDTYKITNILNKYVNIAFKTNNHIYNRIPNNIENNNKYEQSGIYTLECPTCKSIYIGMTRRKFKTRFEEHRKAYIFSDTYKSSYATHLLKEKHTIGNMKDNMIIHTIHHRQNPQILEQIHIQNNLIKGKKLINEQLNCTFATLLRPLRTINPPRS